LSDRVGDATCENARVFFVGVGDDQADVVAFGQHLERVKCRVLLDLKNKVGSEKHGGLWIDFIGKKFLDFSRFEYLEIIRRLARYFQTFNSFFPSSFVLKRWKIDCQHEHQLTSFQRLFFYGQSF
jgi:hypothetical protein